MLHHLAPFRGAAVRRRLEAISPRDADVSEKLSMSRMEKTSEECSCCVDQHCPDSDGSSGQRLSSLAWEVKFRPTFLSLGIYSVDFSFKK